MRTTALAIALGVYVSACESNRDPPPPGPSPRATTETTPTAATTTTAAAGSSASATPAGNAGNVEALAGTWEGRYDAKKGSVEVPKGVKDKTWVTDDGKTSVGPGTVTITVTPTGELSGKSKGALGDSTLTGKAEGSTVRASVLPDDPTLPQAMTGVMVALLKDGVLRGELRVAGPNASVVRESVIELKRK